MESQYASLDLERLHMKYIDSFNAFDPDEANCTALDPIIALKD